MDIYIIQGVPDKLYTTGCFGTTVFYRVLQNIYILRGVPEILEQMYHGKIRNYDKQGGRANDFFTFAKKNLNVFSSVFTPLTFCP